MNKSKFIYCGICENNLFYETFYHNYNMKLECYQCNYNFTYNGLISEDIDKIYFNSKGKFHRQNNPAVNHFDGTRYWIENGKYHRLDGPAAELSNGTKYWYYNDKLIGMSAGGYTQEKFEQWKRIKAFS